MALVVCDIAGDERGTWQAVFDIDAPCLWVQWIPNDLAPYVPDWFTLDDFGSARANRLHKRARESLALLFITSIFRRWQSNQSGPRIQKTRQS